MRCDECKYGHTNPSPGYCRDCMGEPPFEISEEDERRVMAICRACMSDNCANVMGGCCGQETTVQILTDCPDEEWILA